MEAEGSNYLAALTQRLRYKLGLKESEYVDFKMALDQFIKMNANSLAGEGSKMKILELLTSNLPYKFVDEYDCRLLQLSPALPVPETPKKQLLPSVYRDFSKSPAIRNLAGEFMKMSSRILSSPHAVAACQEKDKRLMENWLNQLTGCKYPILLEEFYDCCHSNPKFFITNLLDSLENFLGKMASFATSLFFKILNEMLRSESKRLGRKEFTKWLLDEAFHRALFAVCSEIVHFVNLGRSWIQFPLYSQMKTSAFEISIMIENVIKYESQLRPYVVHHLKKLEESLINEAVWNEEFPFYSTSAYLAESHLQSPRKALASISEDKPLESNTKEKITQLELFYRKLFRQSATKITALCSDLKVPTNVKQLLWNVYVHAICHEPKLQLLRKRSLDVLIVSVIYGVCKMLDISCTFKQLMAAHKSHFSSNELVQNINLKVFKSIFNGTLQDKFDIVQFYNSIFLPAMKDVVYEIAVPGSVPSSPLPKERKRSVSLVLGDPSCSLMVKSFSSPVSTISKNEVGQGFPSQQRPRISSATRRLKFTPN